ncbi:MAG TPA: ATP-binding protein [Pseudomonadales bacterium]|nr:ATP-binding protein [Pseudomonadales bacterium]
MNYRLYVLLLSMLPSVSYASFINNFKDEEGNTIWQYVANFTGGVLIILLFIACIVLIIVQRRVKKANAKLQEMHEVLEQRVSERTRDLQATTDQLQFSEGYIRDILESMPLSLIGLDKQLAVTRWNEHAAKLTEVSSETAIGQDLWTVFPTISLTKRQLEGVITHRNTIEIKHSQRGRYYYDITVYPLSDVENGGIVILIHDVTERIIAENMLVQRDRMSTMGEFAATVARDIDQPLLVLTEDLQHLAQEMEGQSSQWAQLQSAVTRVEQARAVISNLLSFAGKGEGDMHVVDVRELMDHTLELGAELLEEPRGLTFKQVSIVRNYEDPLPSLTCSSTELQQAILGIFRHSLRAMEASDNQKSAEIQVEIMECYEAIWIRIHHNGRGLTGDQQQQIFEPFFLNDQSQDSCCIPLSFSHYIICERHKGQIAVTSDLQLGTTFHIQIPLGMGTVSPAS